MKYLKQGLGLVGLVLWALGTIMFTLWVFVTLWGWFVVPLGLPRLGPFQAAGLMAVVALLKATTLSEEQRKRSWWYRMLVLTLVPLFAFLYGFVAWLLMGYFGG